MKPYAKYSLLFSNQIKHAFRNAIVYPIIVLLLSQNSFGFALSQSSALFKIDASGHKFIQEKQDAAVLEPGKPIDREISGGQEHRYRVQLAAKQFMRITAQQKGINITLVLSNPEGKQLTETNLTSSFGQESLSHEAAVSGSYQIAIQTATATAPTGSYRLQLEVRTTASPIDKQRISAEQTLNEAKPLANKGGAESQQAIEKYEKVLSLWRELNDHYWVAQTMSALAGAHNRLNQNDKAIDYYKQALQVYLEIKDKPGESDILHNLGRVYYRAGRLEEALNLFQQMLAIKREIKDRDGEGGALTNIGAVYNSSGVQDKSLENYEQALKIMREVKNRGGEGFILTGLGNVYLARNEYQKAIDHHQQALLIYRDVKDRETEGLALNNIGYVYYRIGRFDDSIKHYEQALDIAREVKDRRNQNIAINGMGLGNLGMSRYEKAIGYFEQALQNNREIKNNPGIRNAFTNLGICYSSRGEYDKAIDYFEQSAAMSRELKDRRSEGYTFNNIGIVYNYLGRHDKAIEYLERALAIDREFKDKVGEAKVLNNIGLAYGGLKQFAKAAEFYEKALAMTREVQNRGNEPSLLSNLGTAYNELKQHEKSAQYLQQAIEVSREIKDRVVEGRTLSTLADTNYLLGRKDQANANYQQALTILREVKDSTSVAKNLYSMAKLERDQGNFTHARNLIEESLQIVDRLRSTIYNQDSRASYFASNQVYNKFYLDLLMQQHRSDPAKGFDKLAIEASEKSRARGLLELLSEGGAQIRQGVDSKLLEREQTLSRQLNDKADRQMTLLAQGQNSEQIAALKQEISQLETDYEQVQAAIRRTSPRYAALTQPQPLSLGEIQQLLDPDTLLLEYSIGEEQSHLWAISNKGMTSHALPKSEQIEKAARNVYGLLTARTTPLNNESVAQKRLRLAKADTDLQQAAKELSQMVLAPVANELGTKRLVIVADGALQYVPFAMLPVPEKKGQVSLNKKSSFQPLVIEHEIINLPSASTLAVQRRELENRQPAPRNLAVIADPVFDANDERLKTLGNQETFKNVAVAKVEQGSTDATATRKLEHVTEDKLTVSRLPFTRQEAEQILAVAASGSNSMEAVDFKANRATVLSPELGQYKYIHFATHGYLDTERPNLSAIVLSMVNEKGEPQNGFLRAHEIYNLNLPAELVVLSACQTGLGKEIKGEGLIGLTRGFMYAGAKRVVVSLWNVSDKATADLMQRFYREMLSNKQRPAVALRTAQIEMWKQKQWQSPYYWAPFVIQGDWK